jgi:CHAT domain-containing protein
VVEYLIHGDQVVIWVAGPDGAVRTVTPAAGTAGRLAQAADRFRAQAQAEVVDWRRPGPLNAVLRELGELLWDPIPAAWLPADPDEVLIVVPHGDAFTVPFPALRDAGGRYLAQRHCVALVPALAVWPELARRHQAAGGRQDRLLALIDPWPLPAAPAGAAPFRRTTLAGQVFGQFASLYPVSDVRSGPDASAAALLRAARAAPRLQPTVVHLGTHAVALDGDPGDPLDSFVALARTPGGHDGMLRARDIFGQRIPGDTVVLAACATGRGRVTGDGVVGLSRAFLSAGPTTLLLTLCEVGEGASLELTYEFHRQRAQGNCTPAQALARAQRAAIAAGAAPHGWSPFVLYGLG